MDTSPTFAHNHRGVERPAPSAIGIESEADREYVYSWTTPPPGLAASVRNAGVLSPLVLSPKGKLIAGSRRLAAARAARLPSVPAVRVEDTRAAFLNGVWDNLAHRTFTALEVGELLVRLESIAEITEEEVRRTYLPALGLGSSASVLEKYRSLAGLPGAVKTLAADGTLRDHHLLLLAGMPERDAASLAGLFTTLRPSAGEARDLAQLLAELGRRDNVGPDQILARPNVRAVIDTDAAPRARVEGLRGLLRAALVPTLRALEEEIDRLAAEAGLTRSMDLKRPADLGGGSFELRIHVRTPADVVRASVTLGSEAARSAVRRILAILRGEP